MVTTICRGVTRAGSEGLRDRVVNRRRRTRTHSVAASRESVHHHYDIGNDFYRLWLDDTDAILHALTLPPPWTLRLNRRNLPSSTMSAVALYWAPGERGPRSRVRLGGLGAAAHGRAAHGVSVRAFNLSREQVAYARDRAQSAGLSNRIEYVEDDYRNAAGQYDAFVSVGMLEHVGLENFDELGRVVDRSLTSAGRGLIHSIGRNAPAASIRGPKNGSSRGLVPGPSGNEMTGIFEPFRFSILDVENLRLHYARTLRPVDTSSFEQNSETIARMFDDRFVRMWRMYLAASIATFQVGGLQVFQVVFGRESNNAIPWTRDHLYV